MKRVPMPDVAFTSLSTTINGEGYTFSYRFNEVSSRWKMDVYDKDNNLIQGNITLVEGQDLLYGYTNISSILDGGLFTLKLEAGDKRLGRDNFGLDNTHELVYLSNSELE